MTRLHRLLLLRYLVVAVAAGCHLISSITANDYNLQYFGGHSILGSSFSVRGKGISAAQSFMTQTYEKACDCRLACWAHGGCHSASTKPAGEKFECRLSYFYTQNLTLVDDPDSLLSYWLDPKWFWNHGVQEDGLLYFSTINWYSYDYSLGLCAVQPGFRTIMLKTGKQQLVGKKILQKINGHVTMDMHPRPGGGFEWGDGTPFDNNSLTESGMTLTYWGGDAQCVFTPYNGITFYLRTGGYTLTLCQGNPYGVEW